MTEFPFAVGRCHQVTQMRWESPLSGSEKEPASAVMLHVTPMSPKLYFGVALEGVKFELEDLQYYKIVS